jgi:hypothetical protein
MYWNQDYRIESGISEISGIQGSRIESLVLLRINFGNLK